MPVVYTEHQEQVLFVRQFEMAWPELRILAIPNGGLRNRFVGQNLKSEGVRPGVPDLFVPARNLWIEMKKVEGGSVSREQKDWIAYLQSVGHTAIVAKGADDGLRQVRALLGEPRE